MTKIDKIKQELSFHTRREDQGQMSDHWWRNLALLTAEALVELQESIDTHETRRETE